MSPEPSRRQAALRYREERGRQLRTDAQGAVGHPVEVAADFSATSSWDFALLIVPPVGYLVQALRRFRAGRLKDVRMLALDAETLFAIGSPDQDAALGVIGSWPREGVQVTTMEKSGTDSRVTFDIHGEERPVSLYCSSLRTNPWASELIRRLGAMPPDPIDPTASAFGEWAQSESEL